MVCVYSETHRLLSEWANSQRSDAYIRPELLAELPEYQSELAINHSDGEHKPALVVAFLGGTGVGKSALLNRLAGEDIAESGIVRPTSRVVTLYHHTRLHLTELPSGLPLSSIQIRQHNHPEHQHLLWLDMPDFDSIEQHNKHMVLEWLPHIDILIYVVSPERYRDRKAWELLLGEGGKHAWLFVMNHWDRAQQEQITDLQSQLALAGFKQPLLYKTSCLSQQDDDFPLLVHQIQDLSGHVQRQLFAQFQHQRRFQALKNWLDDVAAEFAQRNYSGWQRQTEVIMNAYRDCLVSGLDWAVHDYARHIADNAGPLPEMVLWDQWSQSRLDDALDDLVVATGEFALPSKVIRETLQPLRQSAQKQFNYQVDVSLRRALSQPGNQLQRVLLFLTGLAETVLPLFAMAVVGYQVFLGFYVSTTEDKAYLGTEYAIHSTLLITLSWLIPYFLHKKLKPSRQTTAVRGLKAGIDLALSGQLSDVQAVVQVEISQHVRHSAEIKQWLQDCNSQLNVKLDSQSLDRMLSQH